MNWKLLSVSTTQFCVTWIMRTKAPVTEASIMLKAKEERAPRREEREEAKSNAE